MIANNSQLLNDSGLLYRAGMTQPREKITETLGANVKGLRQRASMSQAELARRMTERGWPWHQSTVYRVESGKQAVRFDEAVDLADLFGTTLDRLAWATGEAAEQAVAEAATQRLREAMIEAADGIVRLLAARAAVQRAARDAAGSDYAYIRALAAGIVEQLRHDTIESVVSSAESRWEELRNEAGVPGVHPNAPSPEPTGEGASSSRAAAHQQN